MATSSSDPLAPSWKKKNKRTKKKQGNGNAKTFKKRRVFGGISSKGGTKEAIKEEVVRWRSASLRRRKR